MLSVGDVVELAFVALQDANSFFLIDLSQQPLSSTMMLMPDCSII